MARLLGEWLSGRGRFQVAICFLPNSRASIDQAPGPIIASVPPRTANTTDNSLPAPASAIHPSMITISAPASGVHKPTKINNPSTAPVICGTMGPPTGTWLCGTTPWNSRRIPVASLWMKRPNPGHPLANVVNSRCTLSPPGAYGSLQRAGNGRRLE
jgi:hypothetical protein